MAVFAAKRLSWREFCTKAEAAADVAGLVLEGRVGGRSIGIVRDAGGEFVDTPADSLEILLAHHFTDHSVWSEGGTGVPEGVGGMKQTISRCGSILTSTRLRQQ